eukprot:351299-Chlamydomonas_euryale.AAC.1
MFCLGRRRGEEESGTRPTLLLTPWWRWCGRGCSSGGGGGGGGELPRQVWGARPHVTAAHHATCAHSRAQPYAMQTRACRRPRTSHDRPRVRQLLVHRRLTAARSAAQPSSASTAAMAATHSVVLVMDYGAEHCFSRRRVSASQSHPQEHAYEGGLP